VEGSSECCVFVVCFFPHAGASSRHRSGDAQDCWPQLAKSRIRSDSNIVDEQGWHDESRLHSVKDLAARFADGRLSTEKLVEANDEELTEMLTAVRGIGKASHTIHDRNQTVTNE
jgi:hypothetical protein